MAVLHAQIGDVDVHAGVDVVKEIPARVIGILVHDKVVGAIPAPIGADRPVPGSDFKAEASGEPETVMIEVEALDAVAEGGAKVLEAPVLEGMVDVEALVIRGFVAVPMIVVDVLSFVDAALDITLGFGPGAGIVALGRSRGDVTLIGARSVHRVLFRMLPAFLRVLGKNRKGDESCYGNWKQEASIHTFLLEHVKSKSFGPDEGTDRTGSRPCHYDARWSVPGYKLF